MSNAAREYWTNMQVPFSDVFKEVDSLFWDTDGSP